MRRVSMLRSGSWARSWSMSLIFSLKKQRLPSFSPKGTMGSPVSASMAASTGSRRPAASTRGCIRLATFCTVTGMLPRICNTATVLATSW
jgi:hypothetical protein